MLEKHTDMKFENTKLQLKSYISVKLLKKKHEKNVGLT